MNDKELEKVNEWWNNLKYLKKIEIMLELYRGFDIAGIEHQGVNSLWNKAGTKRKAEIMKMYEKEQRKERD